MAQAYLPDRGDIVWLDFTPQAGREQAGRRPALVVSPAPYHRKSQLMLVCPITNQIKGYPYEVQLPPGLEASGVVLSDHLKSMDFKARRAKFICQAPHAVVVETLAKLTTLLN